MAAPISLLKDHEDTFFPPSNKVHSNLPVEQVVSAVRISEVTWLPQGHGVRLQLDACSVGLLGDAILEVCWG